MPYLMLTQAGVVAIPDDHIRRDHGAPIEIPNYLWLRVKSQHGRCNAACMTAGKVLLSRSIVVLKNGDGDGDGPSGPSRPSGPPICLWAIRFSVSGGSDHFESTFGRSFLFLLGFPTTVHIAKLEAAKPAPTEQSRLITSLRATPDLFRIEDWPGARLVEEVDCFYDRIFVMSVKPTKNAYTTRNENSPIAPLDLSRPTSMRGAYSYSHGGSDTKAWPETEPEDGGPVRRRLATFRPFSFSLDAAPDDVGDHIVRSMAARLAASPYAKDVRHLLSLRLVSTTFKQTVDEEATRLLRRLLYLIAVAHATENVSDLLVARDAVLDAGIVTLQLICDHHDPSILTWMRLRSGKAPDERPPKAGDPRRPRRALIF